MRRFYAIIFIAFKNILSDNIRSLITVAGVGLAVTLIMLLKGINNGVLIQATAFIENNEADIFVVQKEVNNLYQTISILPSGIGEVISDLKGIKKVEGLITSGATLTTKDGQASHFFYFGLDADAFRGKYWQISKGRVWQNNSEIVLDQVLAKKLKIQLGDQVVVRDRYLTVVGLTKDMANPLGRHAFTSKEAASQIFRLSGVTSYFQIFLEPGANPDQVIKNIKTAVPDIEIYSHEQFHYNHHQMVKDNLTPSIRVMTFISFFVGVTLIGLTLYTNTIDKKKQYGIIKAIGATNSNLYQIVCWQAIVISFFGSWLGIVTSFFVRLLIGYIAPEIKVHFNWQLMLFVYLTANVMSLIAVIIPVKVINRIDPAIAFKE
jgi:putative ABC transport system permease protein